METEEFWDFVRESIVGKDIEITTPFGSRHLIYADYTASGRGVDFIENYLKYILELYANTHTEDDTTGSITTARLHIAEKTIKRLVNAGDNHKIIETGTGTTGAIHHLQKILGIYIPPAAKVLFKQMVQHYFRDYGTDDFESFVLGQRPVVFLGPFEHHSNVVSWRECFAEVVEIELDNEGLLDISDLKRKVSRKEYDQRLKVGSFSAASNVTGIKAPVFEIARILHKNGAYAFFDYAALAPYAEINMMKDEEACFDGIFFSPHKFLGGPGSSGILIINDKIYKKDLPPTTGAGGTVEYVNFSTQDYCEDIETREKPGTPGILQILKASLAMELKEKLNPAEIEKRESILVKKAFEKFHLYPNIEIVGNTDPEKRLAIISFNIKIRDAYLHPRYVTKLLNDLFGIQSRAGCLCAGPYGHRLLNIDRKKSDHYRKMIKKGLHGVKPGWTRVNFHFLITDEEFDFICDAITFISEQGKYFLSLYSFDISSGNWAYRDKREESVSFSLDEGIKNAGEPGGRKNLTHATYASYLKEAKKIAEKLKIDFPEEKLKVTDRDLVPFLYFD